MSKGQHRVTPNSEAGRRMTSGGGTDFHAYLIPQPTREWNRLVEAKKEAKLNTRQEKKNGLPPPI